MVTKNIFPTIITQFWWLNITKLQVKLKKQLKVVTQPFLSSHQISKIILRITGDIKPPPPGGILKAIFLDTEEM